MNCYLVVWPAKNGDAEVITTTFPEHHPVLEGRVYMVAAKQKTCAEVCDAIGIGNGVEIGNGAEKSGLVTKVNDYYGLFDRALVGEDGRMARDVAPSNVVPMQRSGGGSGDDGNYGERLARIESKMGYMATREDVQEVKTLIERKEATMLRWLLGMLVVALVSLGVALFRTFL